MNFNKAIIVMLLAVYIGVPLAFGGDSYVMSLVIASMVIGGVALSWALLGNLGGMVSFGHAAFFQRQRRRAAARHSAVRARWTQDARPGPAPGHPPGRY